MDRETALQTAALNSKTGPCYAVFSNDAKTWCVNTLPILRTMDEIQGYEFDWSTAVMFLGGVRVSRSGEVAA